MRSLANKRILLGVTGGIAAYKSAEIVRRLQDAGAEVRVVMTKGAQEFITPLTMQALSGNPVHADLLDPQAEAAMGHIELSRWADLVLVAPASANFLSKLVAGEGSDLLSTLCLATNAVIAVAPAMNQGMWHNQATQANIETLKQRGVAILGPEAGDQACGDVGLGRMMAPTKIAEASADLFTSGRFAGLTVMITAGPTREAIDPVRYISNHSSGKMGFAIAEAAAESGANVVLITGPVSLPSPDRVKRVDVVSAQDMHAAVHDALAGVDVFIASAAVADYRPAEVALQKLKKGENDLASISMVKNPDIVASVAAVETKPFTVGFAAETHDVEDYAKQKLIAKKLDLVVANNVAEATIGFNSDNNAVTVIGRDLQQTLTTRSKAQIARDLVNIIADAMQADNVS
ncbi:MAG: bifunctional phosphopantothenoylcysteine decarboxylase/phosphopantothenate--cysteine ligase CoaBC [Agarilytica sp.]